MTSLLVSPPATSLTLFEQLGGHDAVEAAVDIFYRKVLADERVARFFDGVDIARQRTKQKVFLTMAFGGPHRYAGKNMRDGHARPRAMGLNDTHFDAVVELLAETLRELGVGENLIQQVAAIAESTRGHVLGR
jgi:hemoglobin